MWPRYCRAVRVRSCHPKTRRLLEGQVSQCIGCQRLTHSKSGGGWIMDGKEAPETVPLYPTSPELQIDPACISKHIYSEWLGSLLSARLSPSGNPNPFSLFFFAVRGDRTGHPHVQRGITEHRTRRRDSDSPVTCPRCKKLPWANPSRKCAPNLMEGTSYISGWHRSQKPEKPAQGTTPDLIPLSYRALRSLFLPASSVQAVQALVQLPVAGFI